MRCGPGFLNRRQVWVIGRRWVLDVCRSPETGESGSSPAQPGNIQTGKHRRETDGEGERETLGNSEQQQGLKSKKKHNQLSLLGLLWQYASNVALKEPAPPKSSTSHTSLILATFDWDSLSDNHHISKGLPTFVDWNSSVVLLLMLGWYGKQWETLLLPERLSNWWQFKSESTSMTWSIFSDTQHWYKI